MNEVGEPSSWNVLKDVIGVLLGIVGLSIAALGLKTWQRQLKGTYEYELAKRLMLSVYELEDGIKGVRNPWVSGDPEETYRKRWDVTLKASRNLRLALMKAQIVWDKRTAKVRLGEMDKLLNRLYNAMDLYLRDKAQGRDKDFLFTQDQESILYAGMTGEGKKYEQDLEQLVSSLDEWVRHHLQK